MRVGAEHGFTMFEYDVKLSKDDVLFLLHDDDLDRTSNGHGPARARTWAELSALSPAPLTRNALVAALLAHLLPALEAFDAGGLSPFLPRYAALDALADRAIRVHEGGQVGDAQALGIAADGALRIRDAGGNERQLHAGDVSVRA